MDADGRPHPVGHSSPHTRWADFGRCLRLRRNEFSVQLPNLDDPPALTSTNISASDSQQYDLLLEVIVATIKRRCILVVKVERGIPFGSLEKMLY